MRAFYTSQFLPAVDTYPIQVLYIIDTKQGNSVTNDAEFVIQQLINNGTLNPEKVSAGTTKIVYRDTEDEIDQLLPVIVNGNVTKVEYNIIGARTVYDAIIQLK